MGELGVGELSVRVRRRMEKEKKDRGVGVHCNIIDEMLGVGHEVVPEKKDAIDKAGSTE